MLSLQRRDARLCLLRKRIVSRTLVGKFGLTALFG